MPKTLIKSSLHFNENRQRLNIKIENNQSQLPQNIQNFKQKLLS